MSGGTEPWLCGRGIRALLGGEQAPLARCRERGLDGRCEVGEVLLAVGVDRPSARSRAAGSRTGTAARSRRSRTPGAPACRCSRCAVGAGERENAQRGRDPQDAEAEHAREVSGASAGVPRHSASPAASRDPRRRAAGAAPRVASSSASARAMYGRVATGTSPSRAIVSRFESSTGSAPRATASARRRRPRGPRCRAASSVSSVWLIVPRPGRGGDHERQAEVGGEPAHVVAVGQRDEQAADALDDQHVVAVRGRRPAAARAVSGSIRRPRQLGGEVRRDRRVRT